MAALPLKLRVGRIMKRLVRWGGVVLAAGMVAACSPSEGSDDYGDGELLGGETYSEYDERRDDLDGSQGYYGGYGCTQDCSGHDAGYNWAEENGITDESDCGGKSWSFIEGCRAYAEDQGSFF